MSAIVVGLFSITSDAQTRNVTWKNVHVGEALNDTIISEYNLTADVNKDTVIQTPSWMKDYTCSVSKVNENRYRFLSCQRGTDIQKILISCTDKLKYNFGNLIIERHTPEGNRSFMIWDGCMVNQSQH